MDIYLPRRAEPRVKLRTTLLVVGMRADGELFEERTTTLDVSPCGAAIATRGLLTRGDRVVVEAITYSFRARALVRSCVADDRTGGFVVGLEYLDGATNPIVIWRGRDAAHPSLEGFGWEAAPGARERDGRDAPRPRLRVV